MSKFMDGQKKIEETVVAGYQKIEDTVVSGYKKIEDSVVSAYKKVEDKFALKFLSDDGDTTSLDTKTGAEGLSSRAPEEPRLSRL